MSLISPPQSTRELLARAECLAGRRLGELADELGQLLPEQPRRTKGKIGTLVEQALGATAGNQDRPDFLQLGVELKTIPLDALGRVQESTFVCSIDLVAAEQEEWQSSRVRRKLGRVLWVPVESAGQKPLRERRLGRAQLWSPSTAEGELLQADWLELMGRIALGGIEEIDGRLGRALQIRPKAPSAAARAAARGPEGELLDVIPRGFYLRAWFTEAILWGGL